MSNDSTQLTLTQRLETMKVSKWHVLLVIVCSLGTFSMNFNQSMVSIAAPVVAAGWGLDSVRQGMIISGSALGMLVGAPLFGRVSDAWGRKKTLLTTIIIFSLFSALSSRAGGFGQLIAMRAVAGLGMGGFVPCCLTYLNEFAPVKVRGRFMAFYVTGNGLASAVVGFSAAGIMGTNPEGWRTIFLIGSLLGLAMLLFMLFVLPESAKWLLSKNRLEDAVKLVEKIEKKSFGELRVEHAQALENSRDEYAQLKEAEKNKSGFRAAFGAEVRKSSFLVIILWFVITYTFFSFLLWLPGLMATQGYELFNGYMFLAVASMVAIITPELVSGIISDKIGRRKTMIIFAAIFAVCGFIFYLKVGWSVLILVWFAAGLNALIHMYTPELFPTHLRGTGTGIGTAGGRIAGVLGPTLIGFIIGQFGLLGVVSANAILLIIAVLGILFLGANTASAAAARKAGKTKDIEEGKVEV